MYQKVKFQFCTYLILIPNATDLSENRKLARSGIRCELSIPHYKIWPVLILNQVARQKTPVHINALKSNRLSKTKQKCSFDPKNTFPNDPCTPISKTQTQSTEQILNTHSSPSAPPPNPNQPARIRIHHPSAFSTNRSQSPLSPFPETYTRAQHKEIRIPDSGTRKRSRAAAAAALGTS